MTKKIYLILSINVWLFLNAFSQAPSWIFSGGAGSANAENTKAVCVDVAGNVYVTGSFSNTVDFDFGAGTANLTSNGSNDIFIASYTSTGGYRWAVRAGGTGNDNATPAGAICTDGTNVYVTGSYNGASTAFGATSLTPNGGTGQDAFAAKLNATTGAWTWAISLGGTGNVDYGVSICLDPSGNPYLLGAFNGTLSGSCANVSLGGSDLYVTKLNPTTGGCVWTSSGGSTGNDASIGGGICYDPNTTELIVSSSFSTGTATFGSFTIPFVGGLDLCVLELNSSTGAWLGAVGTGSTTNDDAISCTYDLSSGNVMVAGAFTGNITLPGSISLTSSSAGFQDSWVGCYSITSNTFLWAKSATGASNDRANAIASDGTGTILIAGQYVSNPTSFGSFSLSNTNSGGFDDAYVVAYSASTGTELWATKNTNSGVQPSGNAAKAIAFAGSGNFWIAGQYAQGCTFGSLSPLNSAGFNDFFIAKLNAPPPLSATQSQVNLSCNGVCNGSATVVASGGTSPYTYSWAPSGGSGATASSLCAGSYTCTITDATAASITKTFTITQPTVLTLNANSQTNVSCFGGNNGAASVVAASGGSGGYTYNWTPGNPTGDGTTSVTGLTAGTWTCTVTDANSCTAVRTFTITQPTVISVTAASQTNVACNGGANGVASINTPTGGAGGYTYNWTPGNPTGDGTVSVTGLTAGTWTCTVTDANSCTAQTSFTITQPTALSVTAASQTNVSCNGGSNGAASINTPTGGAGGYTYNWTPGNPTGDGTVSVTGLTAGTWTCTVTDANSCTAQTTFTITAPTIISASISSTTTSCTANTGTASITGVTGGAGGYTYSWAPSGGTAATATGLAAGSYTCAVTDANSCTITRIVSVTIASGPSLTSASQTNVSCFGGSNGAASVNVATGGAGGYTYNWTPGNPTGDGTISATGLTAGTWTCTVTDANGCTAFQSFTITTPTAISITAASQTNVSCNGGTNATASINTPTGGAGGYTYNWTPGNPTGDGTVSVTGLTAGTWTCTVTDANSCTAQTTFTITQPTALSAIASSQTNVSCNGGFNGAASINTPTGGAGGYTYNWTPGNPTGDGTVSASGLTAGTWTCTVTDANSCTAQTTFTITQPTALSTIASSQTNVSCNGGSNGAASINAPTGGAGGYTYNWTPGNPTGDGTVSVTGLTAGTWTCTVTDANSCTAQTIFTITQPTALSVTAATQTNISCNGGSNGAASINTPTGGAGGYTYNWTPGNPTGDGTTSVTGLTAGSWTCTVTDLNSCTATQIFNITTPTALVASSTASSILCNGGTATVSVSATGGTLSYSGTGSFVVSAGAYSYTVTDANGCTSVTSGTISEPAAITSSQSATVCAGASYTVGANTYSTSGTFVDVLTAANGCDSTVTTNLVVNPAISTTQNITLCSGQTITVGTNTYSTDGNYTDILPAINGCDSTIVTNLTVFPSIAGSQNITLCAGQSITVGANTYNTSGSYSDIFTASNGCDSILTTNLVVNPAIVASQNITLCAGQSITIGTNTYSTSGMYTDVFTAVNGCDSTITTNLTVNPVIDVTTTNTGNTITANATSGSYQWIDCNNGNNSIVGEINQSYIAAISGDYAVVISDNGCSDTSSCVNVIVTGIIENSNLTSLTIYPNPTNGIISIQGKNEIGKVDIYNALGELVYTKVINSNIEKIDISYLQNGIYFLQTGDNLKRIIINQ